MQKLKNIIESISSKAESPRKLFIKELAAKLNVTEVTIYRWANGETKPIHPLIKEELDKLLDKYSDGVKIK